MEIETVEDINLKEKLGAGAFGLVRRGVRSDGEEVAVKLEVMGSRRPMLERETEILSLLQRNSSFPRLYSSGTINTHAYMVIQLLGPSLSHKLRSCNGRLSAPTVLHCAIQMLSALETLHSLHFVHRDIKPQNFLIGLKSFQRQIYLIDYGLARKFQDTGIFRCSEGQPTGTLPYMSINIHLGLTASPRDDLESLAYVLIYLIRGDLPWHNPDQSCLSEQVVRGRKQRTDIMQLCKGLPVELEVLLRYARGLQSNDSINYEALKREFSSAGQKSRFDVVLDWEDTKKNSDKRKRRKSQAQMETPALDVPTQCLSDQPPCIRLSQSPILSPTPMHRPLARDKTLKKVFIGFSPDLRASIQQRKSLPPNLTPS